MTKLQVELAKEEVRVLRAVKKKIKCTKVIISRAHNEIYVHVYNKEEHVYMYGSYTNPTTKQLVQRIINEG